MKKFSNQFIHIHSLLLLIQLLVKSLVLELRGDLGRDVTCEACTNLEGKLGLNCWGRYNEQLMKYEGHFQMVSRRTDITNTSGLYFFPFFNFYFFIEFIVVTLVNKII